MSGHGERVNTTPDEISEMKIWNVEYKNFEDYEVGSKLKSLGRTISEGECTWFNTWVLDIHPYAADETFARKNRFGTRLVAGAMTFSIGLGLVQMNNPSIFSYGYDRLRFINPVFPGDTIYSVRTVTDKEVRDDRLLIRFAYETFIVGEDGEKDRIAMSVEHQCFIRG
jgi:acyl dehydratase